MAIRELIKEIDAEIARLKEARALLTNASHSDVRRGRPKRRSMDLFQGHIKRRVLLISLTVQSVRRLLPLRSNRISNLCSKDIRGINRFGVTS